MRLPKGIVTPAAGGENLQTCVRYEKLDLEGEERGKRGMSNVDDIP